MRIGRKRAPRGCKRCDYCDGSGLLEAYGPGGTVDEPNVIWAACNQCGGAGFVYNPDSPANREYEDHLADQADANSY